MDQNSEKNKGLVYSIQRYSIHDGPGIRTLIFFKGCQMKCPWCSNPESQNSCREIAFSAGKCRDCGKCAKVCAPGAIDLQAQNRIDRSKCDLCGLCVRSCPNEAYTIFGKWMTVDELIAEVEKDRPFYRKSGGGITVSGGEPTLQYEFIREFLKECKNRGLDTAIETHGYAQWNIIESLAPYIDLFQTDIKHMNSELHEKVTGYPNNQILNNIRSLAIDAKKKVAIRIPLIPGFNDTDENIQAVAEFARQINAGGYLHMVHILPYHAMGQSKYEALDRIYSMKGVRTPDAGNVMRFVNMLKSYGLPAQQGG